MLRRRPRSTANHRPRVNRSAKMGADRALASRQTLIVNWPQAKSSLNYWFARWFQCDQANCVSYLFPYITRLH
jgi:hypothetical protein